MSYQVLARKWRPNCFAELVGQEHVVTAISNALDNDRLHHAYLFTGTRGVGKTTIARIFSKSLNCEQGLGSSPCGKCSTCTEIEQGNFIDLLEIDAASRTKVEDTRELLDNVQYRPSRGRYKVYLIDEVHMLSKHSFNALLKTLEEPPPHVKFLLATTDPQKLPVTILSRCLQFNLKALSRTQIAEQLNFVLTQENLSFEPDALSQLARAAQGSMRDALSLTDQAIAQGNGVVNLSVVTEMLGLMDKNAVLKLLRAVMQKNSADVMQFVEQMSSQSADFSQVLAELMSLLHQIALTQFVPEACKLETIAARTIFDMAKSIAPEQVQLLYQIALVGKKDLPYAAEPRSGLEMTLLRMLAFCPDNVQLDPHSVNALATDEVNTSSTLSKLEKKNNTQLTPTPHASESTGAAPESMLENAVANDVPTKPAKMLDEQPSEIHVDDEQSIEHAWPESDDENYNVADSEYEQGLFEQQQAILQQSESYGYNQQSVTEGSTESAQNIPETVAATHVEHAKNTTETMLALRKKLLQSRANEEESASTVKKSEKTELPNLASIRQPTQAAQKEEATPAEAFPLEIPVENENQQNTHIQDSERLNDSPPWESPELPANEQYSESEVGIDNDTDLSLFDNNLPNAMDPHGHLALDAIGEVNIPVPVFLNDQQKVTVASQIDDWSRLIENMPIAALIKQLALHSAFKMAEDTVSLILLASKQHLNTLSAQQQLQAALCQTLDKQIKLEITLGDPINTPFAIQQKINQTRQDYAHEVVNSDVNIQLLQELFAAKVNKDSILAR